jgi:monovalent cation:H+ antiporter-2, CPA2 family
MHSLDLLLPFTGGLAGGLILGYLAKRIGLSPIVGYLLAGIAVGPFTPGYVADRAILEQLAEIGVILMLFGVGLKLHLNELIAVWRVAVPGALIQSALSTMGLAALLHLLGWSWSSGIILGMAISVASTVVMAMVLAGHNDLNAHIGHVAIGWTVVEDILTVLMLLLLPIVFVPGSGDSQGVALMLGTAGLKILGLLAVIIILARWVIPKAFEWIARTNSPELFTLAVLVFAVGIAVGSALIFGVSMALGAFLGGVALGRSEFAGRASGDAVPMRDVFSVLFFISVGMLFDPRSLLKAPLAIVFVLIVVVIGKPLAATLTVRLLGIPLATALPIGAAFAQVGEFSFILGEAARKLGLIDQAGWNALVAASVISIALNPSVYRWVRRWSSRSADFSSLKPGSHETIDPNRCILVGYGPIGRIVHRLLSDRGNQITVIDLNLDTVRHLQAQGGTALYGDIRRPATLGQAGVATAGSFILSVDVDDAAEIIRQVHRLNPHLRILARCPHLRDAPALRRAGAEVVAAGEAEVGVALAEAVMAGDNIKPAAAAEQRDAIRKKLYAAPPS